MLRAAFGVYRNGQVELVDPPSGIPEETRVVITFLEPGVVDLAARGIGEEQAADLQARLRTFAEEWESPEMAGYDAYDLVKTGV